MYVYTFICTYMYISLSETFSLSLFFSFSLGMILVALERQTKKGDEQAQFAHGQLVKIEGNNKNLR